MRSGPPRRHFSRSGQMRANKDAPKTVCHCTARKLTVVWWVRGGVVRQWSSQVRNTPMTTRATLQGYGERVHDRPDDRSRTAAEAQSSTARTQWTATRRNYAAVCYAERLPSEAATSGPLVRGKRLICSRMGIVSTVDRCGTLLCDSRRPRRPGADTIARTRRSSRRPHQGRHLQLLAPWLRLRRLS